MNMLGGVTTDMNLLKSVSIYGFYDPVELVQGADILLTNLGYVAVSLALLAAGVFIFNRKRLPL
jgi:ABC-2 type transport system permease protein